MAQHAYGISGVVNSAIYATADGCIGTYDTEQDCLDPTAFNYPCGYANVDLTGTPISMVSRARGGGWGVRASQRGSRQPCPCALLVGLTAAATPPPPLALQKNEFGVAGVYVADEIDVSADLKTANIFTGEAAALHCPAILSASQPVVCRAPTLLPTPASTPHPPFVQAVTAAGAAPRCRPRRRPRSCATSSRCT